MEIKLTAKEKEKKLLDSPDAVFGIMQRILLRENMIDQEKEHFWMIGLDVTGYILYIELVALGSYKEATIEPMNVYRVAVIKNASRVIAVHNHPSGILNPSEGDKDMTDRLFQAGKILNIELYDHLIISPTSYVSFVAMGLMDTLSKSMKYMPTYQAVEEARREEKRIAKDALKAAKDKMKSELGRNEKSLVSAANYLIGQRIDFEQVAKILEITPDELLKIRSKYN